MNLGKTFQLDPNIFGNLPNSIGWNWTPNIGLNCVNCPNPIISSLESNYYFLQAEDGNGCVAKDTLLLRLDKSCVLFVPNIFSPNGDGTNDIIFSYAPPCVLKINHWAIFDRWGSKVFEAKDFIPNSPTTAWDGNLNGQKVNSGVYVWIAEMELIDGRVVLFSGDIGLV